jgi:sugar lactone lactonase YvrE
MKNVFKPSWFGLIPIALAMLAGVRAQEPASCAPVGDVQFVCGLEAPEDLVVLPGDQWVVAGAYSGRGGLNLIRASDRSAVRAYPGPGAAAGLERFDTKIYGACPGPPDAVTKAKFQIHGMNLMPGANSIHRLFAVLHGGRESVEVFEVDARQATPTLTWIGCAVAPEPIGLNSVRGLSDGGFVATNFLARSGGPGIKAVMSGEKNGELWEWHTASGWQKMAGTEAAGANGLEMSQDERAVYVAAWGGQSVFRVSRGAGTPVPPLRHDVPLGFRADNVRWARDGSLLVAGHTDSPASSVVVKIDPETLAVREILRRPDTLAFGAATVAVEVGRELWLGSFRGNRIAIVASPE